MYEIIYSPDQAHCCLVFFLCHFGAFWAKSANKIAPFLKIFEEEFQKILKNGYFAK